MDSLSKQQSPNVICGCKGIRTCLLCENTKNVDSFQRQFDYEETLYFCSICKNLFSAKNIPISEALSQQTLAETLHQNCTECLSKSSSSFHIEGITVINDFITSQEEEYLLGEIEKHSWNVSQSGRYKQDFGPKVNFKKKKVKTTNFTGFPTEVKSLIEKLKTIPELENFKPVELCNLEYIPERGSSIDPHLDDSWLWGERLVTINLESDTLLTLNRNESPKRILIPMSRRSLLILHGEARHIWLHSIARDDIKNRRIAMTFRELSNEFLPGGSNYEIGKELLLKAQNFF